MLQIIDINTNNTNLDEVEFLKSDFQKKLEPTVKDGTVIIISDFPAVGNMNGKLDYLILLTLKKNGGNYLRLYQNEKYHYIDNFVLLVKKIDEEKITGADSQFIHSDNSSFDYVESLQVYNKEFEDYFKKFDNLRCFTIFQTTTKNDFTYSDKKIIINKKIDANYIIWSVVNQYLDKYGAWRINSFTKEKFEYYHNNVLIDFAKDIVKDTTASSKYSILTKKKLDRISTSTKTVDELYDNVGKSLSIVTGKAGTGKTLILTRIIHKHASNSHHIRFLTFNNLLVFDMKQNLKNFGYFGNNKIAVSTVHHFYYKLCQKLGISIILGEDRVNYLLQICEKRIEKVRPTFESIKSSQENILNVEFILSDLAKTEKNKTDFDEFREFAKFMNYFKNPTSFDEIKIAYLKKKRTLIEPSIGQKKFLEDYYKVLELIFLAVTDSRKFYDDLKIKDRYDLLSALYDTDKFTNENTIPFENFEYQVNTLKRTSNWSNLLIVDECQDFYVLEKEILYKLRGSENLIVASGGKEQLIRHSTVLNWAISLNKKIPSKTFPLYGGSYRQKQNIISFVNKFSDEYGFNLELKSIGESKGLGKIIIDTRSKTSILREDILIEMKANGEINECSAYESLMILIPSKNYTDKRMTESFSVNEKDYIKKTEVSSNRHTVNLKILSKLNIFGWDGVSEDKGRLKVPHQNESRIIHYESCRGLESWTCACMSLDEYFAFKRTSEEAGNHLADDLFLKEDERRDKYSAIWCLMAFTRPIDTLYIHLANPASEFSKKILQIGRNCEGVVIYDKE